MKIIITLIKMMNIIRFLYLGKIDELVKKHNLGLKRKLNPKQQKMIVDVVTNNTQDQVGFECKKNWIIELIQD
ncbi:hypothetical protein UT300005_37530 [Clostridium sp. CTA-5]